MWRRARPKVGGPEPTAAQHFCSHFCWQARRRTAVPSALAVVPLKAKPREIAFVSFYQGVRYQGVKVRIKWNMARKE